MRKLLFFLCAVFMMIITVHTPAYGTGDDGSMPLYELNTDQIDNPSRPDLSLIPEGSDLARDGKLTRTYFRLQDYYAKMLWHWLDDLAGITDYECELKEHELRFRPAEEPSTAYHRKYAFGQGFFCIRSFPCIERLSENELTELRRLEKAGDPGSEECRAFVGATVKKMCTVYADKDDRLQVVQDSDGRSAPNYSVLLGLEIQIDYDAEDLSPEKEKMNAIERLASEYGKKISDAAGVPVTVFVYY